MTNINPRYYKDEDGRDLFDEIEAKYTEEQVITIYGFNIKKYVRRFMQKNGMEDLFKARDYVSELQNYLDDEAGDDIDTLSDRLADLTNQYEVVNGDAKQISDVIDEILTDDSDSDLYEECNRPIINADIDDNDIVEILDEIKTTVKMWFSMLPDSDDSAVNSFKHIKDQYELISIYKFVEYEFNCCNLGDYLTGAFSDEMNSKFGGTRMCELLKEADEDDSKDDDEHLSKECYQPNIDADADSRVVKEKILETIREWLSNNENTMSLVKEFKNIKNEFSIRSIYEFVKCEFNAGRFDDESKSIFSGYFAPDDEFGNTPVCSLLKEADEDE